MTLENLIVTAGTIDIFQTLSALRTLIEFAGNIFPTKRTFFISHVFVATRAILAVIELRRRDCHIAIWAEINLFSAIRAKVVPPFIRLNRRFESSFADRTRSPIPVSRHLLGLKYCGLRTCVTMTAKSNVTATVQTAGGADIAELATTAFD